MSYFLVVLKLMFDFDGVMFYCYFESVLMLILEKEVVKFSGEIVISIYRVELKCYIEL